MRLTPGQVLYLPADLPGIPAGPWVLTQQDRQMTLHRLGENEDGRLCLQSRRVQVTQRQMRWFAPVAVRLSLCREEEGRAPLSALFPQSSGRDEAHATAVVRTKDL